MDLVANLAILNYSSKCRNAKHYPQKSRHPKTPHGISDTPNPSFHDRKTHHGSRGRQGRNK
ncbi:hypothetical protein HJC23_009195 [Cyclotella cryptica]|uniref:Uncharacterized protein n=1 Tax=Cyclotella cryptica TaxID=29204 RepID=A0ABD3NV04_9STRA